MTTNRVPFEKLCPVLHRLIGDLDAEIALHEPGWQSVQITFDRDPSVVPTIDVITTAAVTIADAAQRYMQSTETVSSKVRELAGELLIDDDD